MKVTMDVFSSRLFIVLSPFLLCPEPQQTPNSILSFKLFPAHGAIRWIVFFKILQCDLAVEAHVDVAFLAVLVAAADMYTAESFV